MGPRSPRVVGTTERGSFAFFVSGTSRPGFGVRDALIPFTAPAFWANAAIDRLAAPPAGDAASATSTNAAPASAAMMRAVRTRDLLESETSGLLNYRPGHGSSRNRALSARFRRGVADKPPGYHEPYDRTDARGTSEARRA